MREHGAIIVDGIQAGSTQHCPHCGGHFLVAASGSLEVAKTVLGDMARPRVFCSKCNRLTCGRPGCDPTVYDCVPIEARLEHVEGTTNDKYEQKIKKIEEDGLPIL